MPNESRCFKSNDLLNRSSFEGRHQRNPDASHPFTLGRSLLGMRPPRRADVQACGGGCHASSLHTLMNVRRQFIEELAEFRVNVVGGRHCELLIPAPALVLHM